MKPRVCPNYKEEISEGAEQCEHCGAATELPTVLPADYQPALLIRITRWLKWSIIFIGVILSAGMFATPAWPNLVSYLIASSLFIPPLTFVGIVLSLIALIKESDPDDRATAKNNITILLVLPIIFIVLAIYILSSISRPRESGGPPPAEILMRHLILQYTSEP
jgi:hypothetical protein